LTRGTRGAQRSYLPLGAVDGIFYIVEVLMKRIFALLLMAAVVAAGAVAEEKVLAPAGLQQELGAALQEMSTVQLGTLTVGDLVAVASRVSVAAQKLRYVEKARMASMMLPGAGQFMTGNALGGSLFLVADLAVMAGAAAGAYFLLPSDVQFGSLNYFTTPMATIKTTMMAHNYVDFLPSMAVMAGGMLVKGILGHFSAASAAAAARTNIAEGKITFTPDFGFMGRGFGMGMRMKI